VGRGRPRVRRRQLLPRAAHGRLQRRDILLHLPQQRQGKRAL
jgi:hypothetical protein